MIGNKDSSEINHTTCILKNNLSCDYRTFNNNSKRIDIIDALKGYAIILVVLGHIIVFLEPNNYGSNFLFTLIYSFHMPLFFALSGYLVYGRSINPIWNFVIKKFRALFIPYLVWNIIRLLIVDYPLINHAIIAKTFEFLYHYSYLQFLPTLFFSFLFLIIFISLEHATSNWSFQSFPIIFYILSYIVIMWVLIEQSSLKGWAIPMRWFSPFIIVGYIIAKFKNYLSNFITYSFLISLFVFPVLLPYWDIRVTQFVDVEHVHIVINFILALFGIVLSYCLVKLLKNTKIYNFFIFCGEFSLELYIISSIVGVILQTTQTHLWFGGDIIKLFSGTLIFLFVSLVLSLILSYNKTISIFLFGRWALKYSSGDVISSTVPLTIIIILLYIIYRAYETLSLF